MSKHILIIDDDEPLLSALQTKFENLGYTVTVARDGEEALEVLAEHSFDVVLTDLHMPNKDGFEVLESVKETKNANIPAYVITNLGSEEYCDRARSMGAKQCFVKSLVSLRDVVAAIDEEM